MIGLCLFIQHSVVFETVLTRRCQGYGRIATASYKQWLYRTRLKRTTRKKEGTQMISKTYYL